jgi:hypothetical protein
MAWLISAMDRREGQNPAARCYTAVIESVTPSTEPIEARGKISAYE